MTTQEIVDALSYHTTKQFPRAALTEAPQHREQLIPYLLDALDYAYDNADRLIAEESTYNFHFFAVYLLAQFREKQAFPKLIRFLRKDEKTLDYLFGDALTEGINRCLWCVYDGNLELLKELIESTNAFEYTRGTALEVYTYIAREGLVTREEMVDYFRHLIHECLLDDTTIFPTLASSCIMDEHLFELLSDIKFMYDRELIDLFVNGNYDSFIDFIFSYSRDEKKIPIDDVVKELENWASYNEEPEPMPKPKPLKKTPTVKTLPEKSKKKIGRNDPCPCGSGKKYKKCCLPLGIRFNSDEKEEEEPQSGSINDLFREMRRDYINKPRNLMQDYPSLEPPTGGKRSITEFYSSKAIEIDIPVYKALMHRSIPIFVRRDTRKEDLERIDFLLEAFKMFTQTCEMEHLETFEAFDRKYMVHYESAYWVCKLKDLLDIYEDEIAEGKLAVREAVNAALARMATPT
jgi:hypothetical protein